MRGRSATARATIVAAAALLAAGCGRHPSATSAPASAPVGSSRPAATAARNAAPRGTYDVLTFGPTTGPAASTSALTVTFSQPVDPGWIMYGTTWLAVEALDTQQGGSFITLAGKLTLDATGTQATFTPDAPFRASHEVRLLFGANLKDTSGDTLAPPAGALVSFANVMQDEVFEASFMPTVN